VLKMWDNMTPREQAVYPPAIRELLNPGALRDMLASFAACILNSRTNFPFPLRNWPALHEHIYKHVSPLSMVTSINREWCFSVLKAFILRVPSATTTNPQPQPPHLEPHAHPAHIQGNYHVELDTLSSVLVVASGSMQVTDFSKRQQKRGKALEHEVKNWYPEKVRFDPPNPDPDPDPDPIPNPNPNPNPHRDHSPHPIPDRPEGAESTRA